MKNFGIYFNALYLEKKEVFDLLKNLIEKKDLIFYKFEEQKKILPEFIQCYDASSDGKLDCILVFGGDGTILRAIDLSLKFKAPLLGINLGKLGFLSESSLRELEKSIDELKKNKFKILARMLLKVVLKRNKKVLYSDLALNDAVIYKGQTPRLIDISFSSNRRFVVETRCDGIIVSTPTGSTAYSLSAGGPILSPVMEAIVVAPLNPHILSVRPMVFSSKDIITLKVKDIYNESFLQLDGLNKYRVLKDDEIIVTQASQKVDFIKLSNKTFYQILRKKLHMGKR